MEKENRGGSRSGAGRKTIAPGDKRVLLTISVSPRTAQIITDVATFLDVRKGVALDKIIDVWQQHETI